MPNPTQLTIPKEDLTRNRSGKYALSDPTKKECTRVVKSDIKMQNPHKKKRPRTPAPQLKLLVLANPSQSEHDHDRQADRKK